MQLLNKIALIPGASRPVGRAIATLFGQMGATLVLPVFDWPDSIAEMERDFLQSGFTFHTEKVDLRLEKDVSALTTTIQKKYDQLHYLINNIERGGMPVVHGHYHLPHNEGQWELEIETTLKAKWLLFQHCRPIFDEKEQCAIVNISSIAGQTGRSGAGAPFFNDAYSAANRAIQSLTEQWAREAAPLVRVNELCLGLVRNRHGEETRGWASLDENEKKAIKEQILLNRTGSPSEVAEMVYFLAVKATYMTGSTVKMDGGFTLGSTRVPPFPPGIL